MKRIAIIGAGGIAAQHAAALAELPELWAVTRICDIYPDAARTLAQTVGADTATLDEVLEDPEIDVVDICLPPALHVRIALRALEAGNAPGHASGDGSALFAGLARALVSA